MSVVRNVAVQKVGPLEPSKHDEYGFHQVFLKDIDDDTSIKLNLKKKDDNNSNFIRYNNWISNLIVGNVLEVQMQEKKGNEKFVDQFKPFKLLKKGNDGKVYTNVSESSDIVIETQLERIRQIQYHMGKLADELGKCASIIEEASLSK